jgi:hypothetical protein
MRWWVMGDLGKRIARLELLIGDRRCECERNPQGVRWFVSTMQSEVDEAQRRFDSCPASHAPDDPPLVVFVKTFGDVPRVFTGAAPRGNVLPSRSEAP